MLEGGPEELLSALGRTPAVIGSLLEGVAPGDLHTRPSPEEFSALESVCHLRDIEIDGYSIRIRRILNENNPTLADIDGAQLAIERDYSNQELAPALEAFKVARESNIELLSKVDASALARKGRLEGVGELTLMNLLSLMNQHDEGHLDELRRMARLAAKSGDP